MSRSNSTTSRHPTSINNASREIAVQAFVDANGLIEAMTPSRSGFRWIETTEGGVIDAQNEGRRWRESISSIDGPGYKTKITRRFFVQVRA